MNIKDIDFTDIRTVVIGAKDIPNEDWNKLYNLTYTGDCIKGYPVSTGEHLGHPDCELRVEGYNKPYAVRVNLNKVYAQEAANRAMDKDMHHYIQTQGFSKQFADLVVYLRKRDYDNLIIDRDV